MSRLDRFRPLTPEEKDAIRQEIIDDCELMTDGGCWVYRGTLNGASYAMKYIQGVMRPVGRFMLAYKTRESLDFPADACHGNEVCICTNPDADCCCGNVSDCPRSCVNPDHLFWGEHGNNCKEKESVCFRFGANARKCTRRSLATRNSATRARKRRVEQLTPLFSYEVSSHSWVHRNHGRASEVSPTSLPPMPCTPDRVPMLLGDQCMTTGNPSTCD